ncbi:hypothetical protein BSQ33_20150 [Vibrio gazogenes]|uniref:Uncharacterized protein n=1 Tax=Vibrio gazogenes TaxID=687 RepID=A0A1Z2SLQ0_VIBGA|nr:hypothetical protein BSQ33_20150 [Vibrio gazogenes]
MIKLWFGAQSHSLISLAFSDAPQFLLIDVKRNQKHLFWFSARYQGRIDSHPAQAILKNRP